MTDLTALSPERMRFGIRFSLVARAWRRELDRALAKSGLTDATWTPLVHLAETGGGISQKQLAALVGIDASSLVRLVDILEGRGLVERRADPADRRSRLLSLTPAGDAEMHRIRALLLRSEQAMLADLDDGEVAQMLSALERIAARLHGRDGI